MCKWPPCSGQVFRCKLRLVNTVGGCFDAWAGAYATAFGANEPLPFTHSEFLSEVQWLYRQLEPFDIYMHSDAS